MTERNFATGGEGPDDAVDWVRIHARLKLLRSYLPALIASLIAGGAAGYGGSYLVKPTFASTTLFIPPQQQQSNSAAALASLGALSALAGGAGVKSSAEQYISMMQSNTVSDRIIQHFHLAQVYKAEYKEDARKKLGKLVQMSAGKKDGMIRVDVEDTDPARAAAIANQYVAELRVMTSQLAVTEAQQRRVFFEHLLNDTKQRLVNSQVALEATGFTAGALKAEPRSAAESYAKLRADLTSAEVRLQVMHNSLADTSPEVQQQTSVVRALREQVSRLEASQTTEQGSPDYVGKYRDFKYQETLFDLYSKQYELARLDESREGALIQVVDEAQPAERKLAPRRSMYALLAGLLALAGCALFCWPRTEAPLLPQ